MATTKAREDIKNDLKTLKEDLKTGAREETQRLKEKAAAAEARLREQGDELREKARGYYDDARVRGREYYDDAAERFEEAQRYVVERVQERPVQSTAIALGVGGLGEEEGRGLVRVRPHFASVSGVVLAHAQDAPHGQATRLAFDRQGRRRGGREQPFSHDACSRSDARVAPDGRICDLCPCCIAGTLIVGVAFRAGLLYLIVKLTQGAERASWPRPRLVKTSRTTSRP